MAKLWWQTGCGLPAGRSSSQALIPPPKKIRQSSLISSSSFRSLKGLSDAVYHSLACLLSIVCLIGQSLAEQGGWAVTSGSFQARGTVALQPVSQHSHGAVMATTTLDSLAY